MITHSIALTMSQPERKRAWPQTLTHLGWSIQVVPLYGAATGPLAGWFIVLDEQVPPMRACPWLKQIDVPLVLITPHIRAAQVVARQVPRLAVIANLPPGPWVQTVLPLVPLVQGSPLLVAYPSKKRRAA